MGLLGRARFGTIKAPDTYEKIQKAGEGGQGKVWVVKRNRDKKILVRKEQKVFLMHGSIPSEVHIFESVLTSHARIIDYDHANIASDGSLTLYFEYCKGGDLHDYLPRKGEKGQPEHFLWHCFHQLAEAIAFLHYGYDRHAKNPETPPRSWRRVIHCDIKPGNVFLRRKLAHNGVPDLVLGDFGLATLDSQVKGCGTDEWIGPEIPYMTKQNDVWAVGAIIHALAYGRGPVPSPPKEWRGSSSEWYRHPQSRQPRQLGWEYSTKLNQNMMNCLIKNPDKRVNSLQLTKNVSAERPKGTR